MYTHQFKESEAALGFLNTHHFEPFMNDGAHCQIYRHANGDKALMSSDERNVMVEIIPSRTPDTSLQTPPCAA